MTVALRLGVALQFADLPATYLPFARVTLHIRRSFAVRTTSHYPFTIG